jgi:lysophospholipase L1-like esterase
LSAFLRASNRRSAAPSDPPPQIGLTKGLVYSALVFAVLFVVAEASIRVWAYFFREQYERYDPASEAFVLVPGQHRVGQRIIKINNSGFVGAELQPDSPDLFRILTLGDSCTFGPGDGEGAYPELLQSKLQNIAKGPLRYEVVNGGVEGHWSEMALRRLRSKAPALSPDIVTIYVGWNDLMKFDPLGQADTTRWAGIVTWLDKLWLTKAVRKAAFFFVRPALADPAVGPRSRSGHFANYRPRRYEENLRALVAGVRAVGAQPVLLSLPTVVRADMTVADLKAAAVMFPYYASAYGVGDLLDLLGAYNRSIREIAMEQQVLLIDLDEVFSKRPDSRPYFFDTMHPSRKGHELIADALFESFQRAGLLARTGSKRGTTALPGSTAR